MLEGIERNKQKFEVAMDEAIEKIEAAGREAGAALAARRTAPAPGRIASRIKRPEPKAADPLVEAVTDAFPGARLVAIEPEREAAPAKPSRGSVVTLLPRRAPMWYHRRPGHPDMLLTAGCRLEDFDPSELIRR